MNLVGDVKCGISTTEDRKSEFLARLQNLMLEFGVSKVDVGWDLPKPCERCGEKPQEGPKDPESVYEELAPDDPRLAEPQGPAGPELKPGLEKTEALDLLDNVVEKMPDSEISLEIPGPKKEQDQ
jgi:hypothetical protein